jgi:hypothetical protein
VRSGRGLHLVELSQRDAARPATLEEARNEVERDLVSARAERGREEFFGKLRQKYEVRVEPGAEQAVAGGSVTSR